jgi:hypothetical protein
MNNAAIESAKASPVSSNEQAARPGRLSRRSPDRPQVIYEIQVARSTLPARPDRELSGQMRLDSCGKGGDLFVPDLKPPPTPPPARPPGPTGDPRIVPLATPCRAGTPHQ